MFNQAVICYTKAAADRASAAHNFFGHDFQTGTQNLFTADSRGAARRNADQNLLPLISTDTTDLNAFGKFLRGLARIGW